MKMLSHCCSAMLLLVLGAFTVVTAQRGCRQLGDVAIILDSSQQVEKVTWDAMIQLGQELANRLTISYDLTRVSVLRYGGKVREIFPLNRYFSSTEVSMAIGQLTYEPGLMANLTSALSYLETSVFLEEKGERTNAPNAALFITASQPTVAREKVFLIASRLRRAGIRLFTVGIDGRVDRVELRAIATNPDDTHFFYVRQPEMLAGLTTKIAVDLCRDLQLCTDTADLVFILDTSGSVKEEWRRSLQFARNLVDLLPVGENNVRVAAVAYSNYAYKQFNFTSSYTRDGIKELIDTVQYHDANTNTSGALRLTRTQMFTKEIGNREGVRDVGILITDGKSTWEVENLFYESWKMHNAGIQMYAIGLGTGIDRNELAEIASDPDVAHLFEVSQAEDYVNNAIVLKWSDCDIDVTYCTKKIDLVFVLDHSGSIGESNFKRMLNFVRTLIGVLEINSGTARVGVVTFGDDARIHFKLNEYELGEEAAKAILSIGYGRGSTNTAEALALVNEQMFTEENGDRPDIPNFVVVITDGDSDDFAATVNEARNLKERGVTIQALGIGDPKWLRNTELRAIASAPRDENALQVRDFELLDRVVQAMQDATCNETNKCVDSPCGNGGECKNGTNEYTCRCPQNFAGQNCQYSCPNYYDVVIAVDASGSVGESNYYKILDFLSDFIGDLPAPSDFTKSTRVGILTFSDNVQIQQHIGRYQDVKMTQDTIYYPYTRGTTNTAQAIRIMREVMFTSNNGDRPHVPNLGIIITDGKSQDRPATWREAVKARNQGIHLVAIGITKSVSELELMGIASGPDGQNVFTVDKFHMLDSLRKGLVETMCNALNECDYNWCKNGATCVDGLNTYYCECAPGFIGHYCEQRGSSEMDVAFLIDCSGSVQRENYPKVISFAQSVVNGLIMGGNKTLVAAITFGDYAELLFPLDEYETRYDVMHALAMIPYRAGTTNMAESLKILREKLFTGHSGDRPEAPNYAVIITDGDPDNLEETVNEAVKSRIEGTHILVVGIGTNKEQFLQYSAIASYPQDQTVLTVRRFSQLPSLVSNFTSVLANNQDQCAGVDCGPNGGCKQQYLTYQCVCNVSYTGEHCQRRCTRHVDLALVIDVSADASKDFPIMLNFLRGVISGLNFDFGGTRVSFVCFDNYVKTQFHLNQYLSQQEIIEAITLPKRGSGTDLTGVLYNLKDEIFKKDSGDRKGVQNYVILMSDGQDSYAPSIDLHDTIIYTIGVGRNINRLILNQVNANAYEKARELQWIQSKDDVSRVLEYVLDDMCT